MRGDERVNRHVRAEPASRVNEHDADPARGVAAAVSGHGVPTPSLAAVARAPFVGSSTFDSAAGNLAGAEYLVYQNIAARATVFPRKEVANL
jgi:hypothetical protein